MEEILYNTISKMQFGFMGMAAMILVRLKTCTDIMWASIHAN